MKKIHISVIPCKRKRCIIYPACRNRIHIKCDDLHTYYLNVISTDTTKRYRVGKNELVQLTSKDIWVKYIGSHFPNLITLVPETKKQKPNPYKLTKGK